MALSDNTAKIRALIEGISALPDVGSGGGGHASISALASGKFTLTVDCAEDFMKIEHGLGVNPHFIIVVVEEEVTSENRQGMTLAVGRVKITAEEWGNPITHLIFEYGYDIEGSMVCYAYADCNDVYTGENPDYSDVDNYFYVFPVFDDRVSYNYVPFKAGYTYHWVCGVIDGIN